MASTKNVAGHTIEVSNPDKVFFPDEGLTKGDLVDFYAHVAETALPYLADRPVALVRYPDGIDGPRFFQKDASDHFPDWVTTVTVERLQDGTLDHVIVDNPATLAYLADQGTIEFHTWLARADDLQRPDQAIFDVDPPGDDPSAARAAARRVGRLLEDLGLAPLLKTSGSKGFHVHVALDGSDRFDNVRGFCGDVARLLARRHPKELTVEQRKDQRGDRVFIDYLRNAYGQHAVAPYTVRGRPGAPVATPLHWEELAGTDPRAYSVRNVFRRLGQKADPWGGAWPKGRSLTEATRRLGELRKESSSE